MLTHRKSCFVVFLVTLAVLSYAHWHSRELQIPNYDRVFRAKVSDLRAASLAPTTSIVAVGTDDHIDIFDFANDKLLKRLQLPNTAKQLATTRPMAFDSTGRWLASCFSESAGRRVMRIWNTTDWSVAADVNDYGRGNGCRSFAFSKDGKKMIRVFDRQVGFPGPSIVVYDTFDWSEISATQTAPFYPADVRMDPCTSNAWIIGSVINPTAGDADIKYPTFGIPPLPDSSALISFDTERGHIIDRTKLPISVGDRSSLSISPRCDAIAIHGIAARAQLKLKDKTMIVSNYKDPIDEPTYIIHTANGDNIIEGVSANAFGYLQSSETLSRRSLFRVKTDAITADASADGLTLAVGFANRIEIYKSKQGR